MTDLQAIVNERNAGSWWTERAAESMPAEAPVYVWRCSMCGKWSHARKRPSSHKRTVRRWDGEGPPEGSEVLEEIPPWTNFDGSESDEGGWIVKCGPFDTYEARRLG